MLLYLVQKAWFVFADSVRHWYAGGFYFFSSRAIGILRFIDRFFAVRINFFHIFQPLYQDRTFLGYFFGFFTRLFKVVSGGVVLAAATVLAAAVYVVWALIPVYLIIKIFTFK
ncbi:MAG: hypothetical protein PHP35_01120 [Candidatus Colwellbacteria bacterium]|nr:hypothetical protein [Candidatus Colwellbacteria bacterium]